MDADLKQQLEWMNQNLMSIAQNQALMYCQLKEMGEKIPGREENED